MQNIYNTPLKKKREMKKDRMGRNEKANLENKLLKIALEK